MAKNKARDLDGVLIEIFILFWNIIIANFFQMNQKALQASKFPKV